MSIFRVSQRLLSIGALLSLALPVLALPYNGAGPGVSTIGAGGDYPSLWAACGAIGYAPLTGGDWTFLILNDLTEPVNSTLVGDTGGHAITFRPAPGVDAVVTFTNAQAWAPNRPIAHFTVGAHSLTPFNLVHVPTHNIIIDGSNEAGGTERNLTFKNTAGQGARTLVGIMGDCHNIAVKNCNLDSYGAYAATGSLAPIAVAGVEYAANRYAPANSPADVPQNGLVQNCHIRNFAAQPTAAVAVNRPSVNGTNADHFTFPDNTITSSTTGLEVYSVKNLAVQRNNFQIDCSPAASKLELQNCGIFAQPIATDAGMVISRNRISLAHAGKVRKAAGIVTRELSTNCETLLENNMVAGDFTRTSTSPSSPEFHGILSEARMGSTVTLHHNSIAMAGTPAGFNSSAGFLLAPIDAAPSQYGKAILRNNIIRVGMRDSVAVQTRGTSNTLDSNFNDLFAEPGAFVGRCEPHIILAPDPESLATWQNQSGQDMNSINLDPYKPAAAGLGAWVGPAGAADADLHFSTYPGPAYRAPALASVSEDFDGEVRPLLLVITGADEMPHHKTSVDEWVLY